MLSSLAGPDTGDRQGTWELVIVRGCDRHRLVLLPKRWIVERSLAWLNPFRRLSKDYENTTESSEAMIKIANIQWMLRRVTSALYLH